ncbi:unnamed protein product, partial [Prorocentrum cordatum]
DPLDTNYRIPPGPSRDQLRKISSKFKTFTTAVDGYHPKHFSQLSEGALEVMEGIVNTMNVLGSSPSALKELIVALFRKTTGGRRPIGFFKSFSRIYSRSLSHHCREWERNSAKSKHFNMAPHRHTTDSVWRAVVRGDIADHSGKFVATLLADLKQCYEHIGHHTMLSEGIRCDFPLFALKAALDSYRWPRRLLMDNAVGEPLYPTRGIVAGSSTATFEVKGYMIPTIRDTTINEGTSLSIHIDDLAFDSIGCTVETCLNGLADLAARIFHKFTYTLELPIHMKKLNFTANNFEILKQAPGALGEYSGSIKNSITNLGVDYNVGKIRAAKGCRSKKMSRWKENMKRLPKICRLRDRKQGKPKKVKIYTCGVKPSICYGEEVSGHSPQEIKKLRVQIARLLGIWSPGCDINICWLMKPESDPISHASATLKRYCREWWMTTDSQIKPPDALSPKELRQSYEFSQRFFDQAPRGKGWAYKVRSPLTDSLFWTEQAGWHIKGPTTVKTSNELELKITESSPALIQKLFTADLRQKFLESSVCKKLCEPEVPDDYIHPRANEIRNRGLWGFPFSKVWNSSKWSYDSKRRLRDLICSTTPTSHLLWKRGFKVEPTCLYCGLCDTVFHRSAGKDPLYTQLWIPVPEIKTFPPDDDLVEYCDRVGEIDEFDFTCPTEIFIDGGTLKTLPGRNITGSSKDYATCGKILQDSMKRQIFSQTAGHWRAIQRLDKQLPYTKSRLTRLSSEEIVNGQTNYE